MWRPICDVSRKLETNWSHGWKSLHFDVNHHHALSYLRSYSAGYCLKSSYPSSSSARSQSSSSCACLQLVQPFVTVNLATSHCFDTCLDYSKIVQRQLSDQIPHESFLDSILALGYASHSWQWLKAVSVGAPPSATNLAASLNCSHSWQSFLILLVDISRRDQMLTHIEYLYWYYLCFHVHRRHCWHLMSVSLLSILLVQVAGLQVPFFQKPWLIGYLSYDFYE